jgi:hypothetical protein
LITLLTPSGTSDRIGNNTIVDANGNLTNEGLQYGYKLDKDGNPYIDFNELDWFKNAEPVKVPVEFEPEASAAAKLAEEIGTVQVPVVYVETSGPSYQPNRLTRMGTLPEHAYGFCSVP